MLVVRGCHSMENPSFEDVFPVGKGGFPAGHVSLLEGKLRDKDFENGWVTSFTIQCSESPTNNASIYSVCWWCESPTKCGESSVLIITLSQRQHAEFAHSYIPMAFISQSHRVLASWYTDCSDCFWQSLSKIFNAYISCLCTAYIYIRIYSCFSCGLPSPYLTHQDRQLGSVKAGHHSLDLLAATVSSFQNPPWSTGKGRKFYDVINRRNLPVIYGCFLEWWYPQNTPKWSCLVVRPMVVGYHHFRKPPYIHVPWSHTKYSHHECFGGPDQLWTPLSMSTINLLGHRLSIYRTCLLTPGCS